MAAFSDLVLVGRVVKPQGRHGEVAVEPFSDREDRFPTLRHAFVPAPGGEAREVQVERCWPHKHRFVLKLAGIDSIDAAETLRGAELRIAESELQALPEGSYYYHQLTGLQVDDEQGKAIGVVESVMETGAETRVLVVRGPEGEIAAAVRRGLREIGRPRRAAASSRPARSTPVRIDVVTIFPRMLSEPLADGIVGRACAAGLVAIHVHDLRDHTDDRHRSVDDAPFGGGPGMVMKAEPFARALEAIRAEADEARPAREAVVLLSPRGRRFDQQTARRFAGLERLVLLCGRYEGIDERVAQSLATEELSLGRLRADRRRDGGARGGRGHRAPAAGRPRGRGVGGRRLVRGRAARLAALHAASRVARRCACRRCCCRATTRASARWRRRESLRATRERRPELLAAASLTREDRELVQGDRGRRTGAGGPGALDKNPAVIHK